MLGDTNVGRSVAARVAMNRAQVGVCCVGVSEWTESLAEGLALRGLENARSQVLLCGVYESCTGEGEEGKARRLWGWERTRGVELGDGQAGFGMHKALCKSCVRGHKGRSQRAERAFSGVGIAYGATGNMKWVS